MELQRGAAVRLAVRGGRLRFWKLKLAANEPLLHFC